MIEIWPKTREKIGYDGWRQIIQKFFLLPNGKEERFDIIGNKSFVTVAGVTVDKKFILVRQFRPGPEQVLWSFTEGYIDTGESPLVAAQRELLEETGFVAENLQFLKEKRSAYSTERQYSILATGCRQVQPQQLDANEFIEVQLMDISAFREFLRNPHGPIFTNVDAAYLALDNMGLLG